MGQGRRRLRRDVERLWARESGVQSVFMMDISFMLVATACYFIAKRGSGVFAASNTQLHYLSNRETGTCIDFLFCYHTLSSCSSLGYMYAR
jgi:hypothetical protein